MKKTVYFIANDYGESFGPYDSTEDALEAANEYGSGNDLTVYAGSRIGEATMQMVFKED